MQAVISVTSAWQQLRNREITCETALKLLVTEQGVIRLDLLDAEVSFRFFRELSDRKAMPPVVPLLLWGNSYYLGCPVFLAPEEIEQLSDRTLTNIKIVPISERSYRIWLRTQKFNAHSINSASTINPLTGELEQENIGEVAEVYLSKATDQIGRIKTLISGALRNRASDIHLEPSSEGLRVRYRIDGILRDVTILPVEISRSGKQKGKQNHICKECGRQFVNTYSPSTGYSDEFKRECLKMYVNGSGFTCFAQAAPTSN